MGDPQDLMRRISSAGERVDPGLSDRDVERLVAGARRQRQRRASTRRAVLAAGAAVSVVLVGALVVHRGWHPHRPEVAATPPNEAAPVAEHILRLSDGSMAAPLDPETEIELVEEHPERVGLSLVRGRGRFEVTPRPKRTFVVRAGDVTVTVVGTMFTVERVADRVGVAVQRGTVRVDWAAGSALVSAGQSGWYPPLVTTASVDRPPVAAKTAHLTRAPSGTAAAVATAGTDTREAAAELLLAADRARLAGHAGEGAELLRTLLREHAADPRAPLAAFTLGRLLLTELDRPAEAAEAFALVRRLSPGGPFAEDSLAREVEALDKAGLAADARARAQEYQRLYPNGRRMATVRTAGGTK
jgi:transmembrane sensor